MNARDEQILRAQAIARAFEDNGNDDVLNVLGPALRDALAEVWPQECNFCELPAAFGWLNLDGLRDGRSESDPEPECFAQHGQGWECTLTPGHSGEHVAEDSMGVIHAKWPDEPKVIAETRAVLNARIAAKDISDRWLERFGGVL